MMQIKIIGVTRCCRQALLKRMYLHDDPFHKIWSISFLPAEYNNNPTWQLFVNDIDIGFISRRDLSKINGSTQSTVKVEEYISATGRRYYNCFLRFIKLDEIHEKKEGCI